MVEGYAVLNDDNKIIAWFATLSDALDYRDWKNDHRVMIFYVTATPAIADSYWSDEE